MSGYQLTRDNEVSGKIKLQRWMTRNSIISYVFALPFMTLFTIFVALPVIVSIALSFTSFDVVSMPRFIGIENYARLFLRDRIFLQSIATTFVLASVVGIGGYILSYLMAWMINELTPKLRMLITLVFYAPSISGNVYLIWIVLFSSDEYGYINGFLMRYGFINQPIQWLQNPEYMMGIVIVVALWVSFGVNFLTFIAGLQGVERTYYEAGAIDGLKNRWQELWFITLPLMRPQLIFGAVISISASFGIGAITTALCGFPSTDYAVHTMMNHLDDYGGIRFEMGYASAIATLLFIMMISVNFLVRKAIKNIGN